MVYRILELRFASENDAPAFLRSSTSWYVFVDSRVRLYGIVGTVCLRRGLLIANRVSPPTDPRSSRLLEAQTVKICRGSSGLMSRLASKRKSRSGRPPLSELNWLLRPASFDLYYHDRLMGVIPWTDGVLYSTYCTLSASKERYQMLLSQWSIC